MFNEIKTTARILGDVLSGKALAETLIPTERNYVSLEILHADGSMTFHDGYNSRVNSGASWQAGIMGSASGQPANYVALSTTNLSPAATDTTLTGEITSGVNAGLARTAGAYQNYVAPSSLGGAAQYQITKTFTSSAAATVQSAALFYVSTGAGMFVEANLSPVATLASGDQCVLTWTVNI